MSKNLLDYDRRTQTVEIDPDAVRVAREFFGRLWERALRVFAAYPCLPIG